MRLLALPGGAMAQAVGTADEVEDFEQELVDQYALAMAAAGLSDGHIGSSRTIVIEFARSLTCPLWAATPQDADRFMADQRRLGRSVSTRAGKAGALSTFYDFVLDRYAGTIRTATGVQVEQPIDEYNRQHGTTSLPRCGAGSGCGSTSRSCSTSATGDPTWARSANSTSASARAAGDVAPSRDWYRRSMGQTSSSIGGWPRSVPSTVPIGPTPMHRCCPLNASTVIWGAVAGPAPMSCGVLSRHRSTCRCRPGR